MKSVHCLFALTFLIALLSGVQSGSAAVLPPIEDLVHAPAWTPKIKPGPKPAPGWDKCPKTPFRPCYPDKRICRGGF